MAYTDELAQNGWMEDLPWVALKVRECSTTHRASHATPTEYQAPRGRRGRATNLPPKLMETCRLKPVVPLATSAATESLRNRAWLWELEKWAAKAVLMCTASAARAN